MVFMFFKLVDKPTAAIVILKNILAESLIVGIAIAYEPFLLSKLKKK